MSYSVQHLQETAEIVAKIDPAACEKCVAELRGVRDRGGRRGGRVTGPAGY